jgi:vancomycin permeability regulator SanA
MYSRKVNFFRRLILILILLYLISAFAILIGGLFSTYQTAEYAIVLGNKVDESGRPSPRLAARLVRAIGIYHRGDVKKIIVSGATGKEGYNEAITMAAYLRIKDIPRSDIIIDSLGYNTMATARNARAIVGEDRSVIVISQYFHIPRVKLAFSKAGFKRIGAAYPKYYELRDVYSLLREVPAYALYLVKSD